MDLQKGNFDNEDIQRNNRYNNNETFIRKCDLPPFVCKRKFEWESKKEENGSVNKQLELVNK